MAKKLWNWSFIFTYCPLHIVTAIQWLPTWYIQMYTVQWGCWLLTPLEWVAGLGMGMGTSTARGARFPVPNRSYPAERKPARSSPTHPIARQSGSEQLRRSTAKILLALLYVIRCTTVYPKKYAHGFCFAVLCCGYTLTDSPISTRLTSLALWQSNDCPSASKATLMNMDKYFMWIHYERLHNHNKAKHNKTVCIFLGIYCRTP